MQIKIKGNITWLEARELVEIQYIDDTPRPGRTKTSTTRWQSCARIVAEVVGTPGRQPVSASTVYRVLTENRYSVFKRTIKLGLVEENKKAGLIQCLEYKNQTLEDQKNISFSDETSV